MSQLDRKKLLKNCGCRAAAKLSNPKRYANFLPKMFKGTATPARDGHTDQIELQSVSYSTLKRSIRRPRKLVSNPHRHHRPRRRYYYSYPIYGAQQAPGYTYYDQSSFCRWVWNGLFWQCYPWNPYQSALYFGAPDLSPTITVSGTQSNPAAEFSDVIIVRSRDIPPAWSNYYAVVKSYAKPANFPSGLWKAIWAQESLGAAWTTKPQGYPKLSGPFTDYQGKRWYLVAVTSVPAQVGVGQHHPAKPGAGYTAPAKRLSNQHHPAKPGAGYTAPAKRVAFAPVAAPIVTKGVTGTWLPAVSNVNIVPPGVTTYVLFDGNGTRGWKYIAGVNAPTAVNITATQAGGPTGLLVQATPTIVGCVACSAAPIVGRRKSWPRRGANVGVRRFDANAP